MSLCSVDVCCAYVVAKGLCRYHYQISKYTPCIDCSTPCRDRSPRCRPCAMTAMRGPSHHNYREGKTIDSHGYVKLSGKQGHPNAQKSGKILEHVWVMSMYLGRPLEKWETVHHVDNDRQNNLIENLQLRIGKHGKGSAYKCFDCGSERIGPTTLKGV